MRFVAQNRYRKLIGCLWREDHDEKRNRGEHRDWEAFIAGDKKKATPGKTERRKKIEAALSRIESQMARLGEEVATLHRLLHEDE